MISVSLEEMCKRDVMVQEMKKESIPSKTDIKSLDLTQLQAFAETLGEPRFRAKQLYRWMHVKHVTSFEEMTDLPKAFVEKLKTQAELTVLREVEKQCSAVDGTRKYLFALPDGNVIESVLMKYHHGNSVCISSQVGCRMGCGFCASTLGGRIRDLTAGEMLEQVYRIGEDTGERISNVVVMGTGEPLDNYDNLLRFLRLLTDENGMHISQRSVTVSTCGLVPQIKRLAEEKLQITLAISLHAATDEKRRAMMPIAGKYSIREIMEACDAYFAKTGRRISFEYSLAAGVNDSEEDARQLARLLHGRNCHVNLIPINPVKERKYIASEYKVVVKFQKRLEERGINATVRREMGRDIDGACGQLRRRYEQTTAQTKDMIE